MIIKHKYEICCVKQSASCKQKYKKLNLEIFYQFLPFFDFKFCHVHVMYLIWYGQHNNEHRTKQMKIAVDVSKFNMLNRAYFFGLN